MRDTNKTIEFYKKVFGAEIRRHYGSDGKSVIHAEVKIGDSVLLMSDEFPAMNCLSPQSIGGTSSAIHLYVKDVDAVFKQAVSAGSTVIMPLTDAFWGDRYGQLMDPFGHKQDLSEEEICKAGEAAFSHMASEHSK